MMEQLVCWEISVCQSIINPGTTGSVTTTVSDGREPTSFLLRHWRQS